MTTKIVILAQYRSGGSYLSQALSNGAPILSEPYLPDDGFISTKEDNLKRFIEVRNQIMAHGVSKLVRFENFVRMMEEFKVEIPPEVQIICLYRHPYTQIASQLFKFDNWADNWTPRHHFWTAIEEYRKHFELCEHVKVKIPGVVSLKYEDTIGEGIAGTLDFIYGAEASTYLAYALEVQKTSFPLGPVSDGAPWEPSAYALTEKEKYWVWEKLTDVMEALGYVR
jgi:hypothetical protein